MSDPNTGPRWRQVDLWCEDWRGRRADGAHGWFVRKGEFWRLRFLPFDGRDETATTFVDRMTTGLKEQGATRRYAEVVYEPETGLVSQQLRPRSRDYCARGDHRDTIDTTPVDPEKLQTVLADYISGRGTFHTTQLEAAFRTVPRHLFLPAWTGRRPTHPSSS